MNKSYITKRSRNKHEIERLRFMFRPLTVIIFIFILLSNFTFAQKYKDSAWSQRSSFGIFGNVDYNMHTANFVGLPGIPSCCPRYETGTGIAASAGLFYAFPVMTGWDLVLRLQYTNLSALLSTLEPTLVAVPPSYLGVNGEFEHSIDASIASAGLEPLMSYRISDQLRFNAGLRLAYIMTKKFNQKEEIKKPSTGVFEEERKRTRHVYNDMEIPDASALDAALVAGLSYDLPLNSTYTIFLVPEIFYTYSFLPIASGLTWNVSSFNVGIAIRWAPREIIPPKPPPAPPLPPPLPKLPPPPSVPVLDASITAVSVDTNGVESPVSQMIIEEFRATRLQPFLNYIFFEENSSALDMRYKRMTDQEKEEFRGDDKFLYHLSMLDVYYQIINIVGKRMSAYPNAVLTITGCNSDEGSEKGNTGLSQRRAETIKKFITSQWGIDDNRIIVKAQNLPSISSNLTDPDGVLENRRVEITANIPEILKPLQIEELERTSNPPVVRFKPVIRSEVGIATWQIITAQSGGQLKVFSGEGDLAPKLDWDIAKEQQIVPRFDEPLKYKMEIIDNDDKIWESPTQEMPVEQITVQRKMADFTLEDKEIFRYSLIGFDFNKATLNTEHLSIIEEAKKRIQKNSTVLIEGYTDRIGAEDLNQKLSERRAITTTNALHLNQNIAKGNGEKIELFNNNLPEGRFYSRTVNITIITPIEF